MGSPVTAGVGKWHFLLLCMPVLFQQACACEREADRAASLVAPLEERSELRGGYVLKSIGPAAPHAFSYVIESQGETVVVEFRRRADGQPAFTRTRHCNVVYLLGGPSNIKTPKHLALAVEDLAAAASFHDEACLQLEESPASMEAEAPQETLPWTLFLAVVLLAAAVGPAVGFAFSRLPARSGGILFILAVCVIAFAGAAVRMNSVSAPFCASTYASRIELAGHPLWELLTMHVHDYRHPPLAFVVLHFMLYFGSGEALLRLPFILFATLALPLFAILGEKIGGRWTGIGACLICAFMAPVVAIGSQIMSHALLFFLAPACLLAFALLLERPTAKTCILSGVVTALALWTSYFAVFLVVVQLVVLAALKLQETRSAARPLAALRSFLASFLPDRGETPGEGGDRHAGLRKRLGRSIIISMALGALPVFFLIKGLVRDMAVRSYAEQAPEALWGAQGIVDIMRSDVAIAGKYVIAVLLVLAVAGTVEVARAAASSRTPGNTLALALAAFAWLFQITLLFLTPIVRMKPMYIGLTLPFFALIAVRASSSIPRSVAGYFSRKRASRLSAMLRAVMTWALGAAVVFIPLWHAFSHALPAMNRTDSGCAIHETIDAIRSENIRAMVLVHGYSRPLVGYYLKDGAIGDPAAVGRGERVWVYRPYVIYSLCSYEELGTGWRELAERRLKSIVDAEKEVLLLAFPCEETWPELEKAGTCTLLRTLKEARLLKCGGHGQQVDAG